jgi:Tol biopolymer transport system component
MFLYLSGLAAPAFAEEIGSALKPVFQRYMDTGGVYSAAISSDGRYMAVGRTNMFELWDIVKGGEGKITESYGIRDITSLQFSPDGRFIAIGGYRTIEIWSLPERTLFKRIEGYGDYITLLTFSPDGRFLASGSRGLSHSIRIWEVSSGRVSKTLEWDWKYADDVRAMAFSYDGLKLVSVAMDNIIRIWDVRSGMVEKVFNKERTEIPVSLSFSPDGEMLAAGTTHGGITLWRLSGGSVIRHIDAHRGSVPSVRFSKDNKRVVSAGIDKRVLSWDIDTGISTEAQRINQDIEILALSGDSKVMLLVAREGVSSYRITEQGGVPPVVAILYPSDRQTVHKPQVTVSVKIVDDNGIADVSVELNGAEVQGGDTGARDLKIMPAGDRKELDLTWNLSLKRGSNRVTVVAYDSANLITRKSLEINYSEEHGEVWGVVIGISRYKYIEGLRYADKDAKAIYEYLTKDNGIPESHITFISNEEATLQRIKDVLGVDIKGKAREKDTVIIYFAGHGASEPDRDSPDGDGMEKYFLTHDSNPKRLYSTALPMQEMARIFSRIDAERIVLIQDTCYSGASGGRTIQTASIRASISDAYLNRVTKGKGRVIITASQAGEVSMEKDSLGHGVFTYYLLEALRHGDNDRDGFITTGEIYRYVSEKVPAETNRNQHPVKKGEEVEGEIVIGKVRGE